MMVSGAAASLPLLSPFFNPLFVPNKRKNQTTTGGGGREEEEREVGEGARNHLATLSCPYACFVFALVFRVGGLPLKLY